MSTSLRIPKWLGRGALAILVGAALLTSISTSASAGTGLPGSALYGFYDLNYYGETGAGDNILRLENPNGNANFSFGRVTNLCAMIYVLDDNEEMGACCGCPVTPAQLATFSIERNLISNWGLAGYPPADGAIAIRASAINDTGCVSFAPPVVIAPACNGGCDPAVGYSQTNSSANLLGSITHVQQIYQGPIDLTEVGLFDNGGGNPLNNTYLIQQCAALVGNGSGGGICNCPVE